MGSEKVMKPESSNSRIVINPSVQIDTGEILDRIMLPYGIGIDCHSKFYQLYLMYEKVFGSKIYNKYELTFDAIPSEIEDAYKKVYELLYENCEDFQNNAQPLHYTLESTGPYHRPLILIWGGDPCIVNPLLATPSRRKTDKLDAKLLCNYDITGLFQRSYIPDEKLQEIKQLFSEYRRCKKLTTMYSNRILNLITYFGNTIGTFGKVTSAGVRPYIEDMCNGINVYHQGILKQPPGSICCQILNCYTEYDKYKEKSNEIQKLIENKIMNMEYNSLKGKISGKELLMYLTSIPGVGIFTAMTFISEICDPTRFEHQKQVVAYCGFDPTLKISAGKVVSAKMRRGNKHLHSIIMKGAGTLLTKHKELFGSWGLRIQRKNAKGGYKKACAAIGRKIVVSLYMCWLKKEYFSYEKYIDKRTLIKEIDIKDLDLSNTTKNKILKQGIFTTRDLDEQRATGNLYSIKGIGLKTIKEIEECLNKIRQSERAFLSED